MSAQQQQQQRALQLNHINSQLGMIRMRYEMIKDYMITDKLINKYSPSSETYAKNETYLAIDEANALIGEAAQLRVDLENLLHMFDA